MPCPPPFKTTFVQKVGVCVCVCVCVLIDIIHGTGLETNHVR